jgi:hypothetical protein
MARCGLQREAHYAGQSECDRRADLQAEHCARQANAQTDLKVKQQFLELKRLWLLLARAQSLTNSSELDRTADKMAKL